MNRHCAQHAESCWLKQGWPLALLALAAYWFLFFNELRGEWKINAQYNYGYVVPLLGAMLVWRRWQERPAAAAGGSAVPGLIASGVLLFLLPLRVVLEANPEWRLAYWLHGSLILILSGCLFYRAGGWNWVRFFAAPFAFMLIAIPWPMELEQSATQNLMRFVAGLTVVVAGWMGIPAVQHGNLIEAGAGTVGISEACSGVRSLQSALMLSLFLCEMHRLSRWRRTMLVAASLAWVLVANLARTSFLTWVAASRGLPQMEAWHDAAGMLVMVIVLAGLFAMAHWMKPKTQRIFSNPTTAVFAPAAIPGWVAVSVLIWMGVIEISTEGWYLFHERALVPNAAWSAAWPTEEAHFQKTDIPPESLAILRCSKSDSAAWQDDANNLWSAFFLRWNAGENSVQLAKGHRPDICFPAAGAKLVENCGQVVAYANGIALPFKYETFESGPRLLHVFYCLWPDCLVPGRESLAENETWTSRLQAAWLGERNLGQQVLEVVISGPETSEAAVSLFQQQVPQLIRPWK